MHSCCRLLCQSRASRRAWCVLFKYLSIICLSFCVCSERVPAVDWQSSEPFRGIFTSRFAIIARQNLGARGKGSVVNYPRGAGSNANCTPHSAGNCGTPGGRDRAWGRSGCERWNKAEKDISKTGALCRHHSGALKMAWWKTARIQTRFLHFRYLWLNWLHASIATAIFRFYIVSLIFTCYTACPGRE